MHGNLIFSSFARNQSCLVTRALHAIKAA